MHDVRCNPAETPEAATCRCPAASERGRPYAVHVVRAVRTRGVRAQRGFSGSAAVAGHRDIGCGPVAVLPADAGG